MKPLYTILRDTPFSLSGVDELEMRLRTQFPWKHGESALSYEVAPTSANPRRGLLQPASTTALPTTASFAEGCLALITSDAKTIDQEMVNMHDISLSPDMNILWVANFMQAPPQ